jgi:hypothetical protein
LIDALKNKGKVATFAKKTGLTIDYLTILKREANSYFPNPVRLSAFTDVSSDTIETLQWARIVNSKP